MSHEEFEATMKRIRRACTLVYQAERATYYNVSTASGEILEKVEKLLDEAADRMGEEF